MTSHSARIFKKQYSNNAFIYDCLQELCLYLDEERAGGGGGGGGLCEECGGAGASSASPPGLQPGPVRDEGDGSSSSTNNDESPDPSLVEELTAVTAREKAREKVYLKGGKGMVIMNGESWMPANILV